MVVDKMSLEKMVWTKWYRQNDTNITVQKNHQSIYQSRFHRQYDFFINPASTWIPLHFLCVLALFVTSGY